MATGGGGAQFIGGIYAELGLDDRDAVDRFNRIEGIMDRVRQRAAALDAQIRAGTYAPGPELDAAIARFDHLQDVMQGLQAAQTRLASAATTVNTAMAGVQQGGGGMGQTLLQVGYIADDLQYGFAAIANNLPQLFAGLGPAAIGGVAVMATATTQIIKHWDAVAPAVQEALAGIGIAVDLVVSDDHLTKFEQLTKHVKDLTRAADDSVAAYHRLLAAQKELDATKEAATAFKAVAEAAPTPEDTATGKVVAKLITGPVAAGGLGGGGGLEDKILGVYRTKGTMFQFGPEADKAQKRLTDLEAQLAAAQEKFAREESDVNLGIVEGLKEQIEGTAFFRLTGRGPAGARTEAQRLAVEQERKAREFIQGQIGRATKGDEDAFKYLEGMLGIIDPATLDKLRKDVDKARAGADREAAAEVDAEAQRLTDLDAENLKKFTEARAKNRKTALERAQSLMKGEMGQQAIAGTLQERDVRDALERAGVAPDVAARRAGDVRDAMADIVKRQVRDRALGKGMTADEAAVALMEDEEKRRKREADAKFDQEKSAALKAAQEAIPDLAGQTERRLLHTPGAAKDVDDAAAAQLQAALTAGGMGQDQAALAALLTVRDARKKLQDQATKAKEDPFAMMDLMGEGEPKRKSQTLDALAYARSIQAGVGGEDVGKKQLEKMDRTNTTLNQIRLLLANPRPRGVFLPAN